MKHLQRLLRCNMSHAFATLDIVFPIIGLVIILLVFAAIAFGQDQPNAVRLEVTPARPTAPALKHRLLPAMRELNSGNAVFHYQRAHTPEFFGPIQRHEDFAKFTDWLSLPLDKFPVDKARGLLVGQSLNEIDAGARRLHCDWELLDRLRKNGVHTLLPELQITRTFASLLALRARIEMHDKQYDRAVHTLQTGYRLARHAGEGPTLINALVGIAIAGIMNKQLETLLQQPDAPNLYWPLASLPRPFIDMQIALEGEALMIDALFPSIREVAYKTPGKALPAQEIQRTIDGLTDVMGGPTETRLIAALYVAKVFPEAKKYFLEEGWTEEQISAVPVTQVALMYAVVDYDRELDDTIKLARLPYWEARPRYAALVDRLKEARSGNRTSPGMLAQFLMPAMQNVALAQVRLDRQFAALRCVEAVRLYSAQESKLPAALDAITDVPVPHDPMTGKAFEYRLEKGTAHLTGPAPQGEAASERNAIYYQITLRKP